MNINFDEINLLYDSDNSDNILNKIYDGYLSKIENLDYLINNIDKISDEEFVKILNSMCRYLLDEEDLVKIVSVMNNKEYIDCDTMLTTMYYDGYDSKDCINYKISYTENANFNPNHYYNIEEISTLVKNKEIVILSELYNDMWSESDNEYRYEVYKNFSTKNLDFEKYFLNSWFYDITDYLKGTDNKYKIAVFKYIRSNVKKHMLEEGMLGYLENINNDLEYLIKKNNKRAKTCMMDFTKKGYAENLKKLTLKYDTNI